MTVRLLAAAIVLIASTVSVPQDARAQTTDKPLDTAVRLADWQLARMGQVVASRKTNETENPRSWEQAVFWVV
jgi:hypothetical protein